MKKLLLVMAIGAFAACNNSGETKAATDSDSTAVTAPAPDSTTSTPDSTMAKPDSTSAAKPDSTAK